jgi:carboxypeptidase C (cathepsin A)
LIVSRFSLRAIAPAAVALCASAALCAAAAPAGSPDKRPDGEVDKPDGHKFEPFKPDSVTTEGSVTIGAKTITYQAIAGTLIVHPRGWDDVPQDPAQKPAAGEEGGEHNPTAEASMFYVAYFKKGGGNRPLTFFYNGGPG